MDSRRDFLKKTGLAGAAAMVLPHWACAETKGMAAPFAAEEIPYQQQVLPYSYNALEPAIDAMTMEIHHGRHHAAYVSNLNAALAQNGETTGSQR